VSFEVALQRARRQCHGCEASCRDVRVFLSS
jgi:hypothetical protein